MAITISSQAYSELWDETNQILQHTDPSDALDRTWNFPAVLGQGFVREIELREGLELEISDHQLHKHMLRKFDEHDHPIQYGFLLAGQFQGLTTTQDKEERVIPGQYWFCGSGFAPEGLYQQAGQQPMIQINVHISPTLFQSFMTEPGTAIDAALLHLLKPPDQEYFYRYGTTTPEMQIAVQQLLRCRYQGAAKRIYLESKVLELLALMVEQEIEIQTGKICPPTLTPDDLDRIYQAGTILLQQLDCPPSLIDLAHQVKLNDCTLKRGFREVFGKTAFDYLHDHRLAQASQFLAVGDMSVAEVAREIGFTHRGHFAAAFKEKFGMAPKAYAIAHRKRQLL
jgi:AraC family transcriptional regulator, transcriptional activator of the genes for pyochelin and ferripyochelin receptors